MITPHPRLRSAFSLIELVIVVVIIGIIAAIAIPRMSRGAAGAADGALVADLRVLRTAIDHYQTEHGALPGATIVNQLTLYSDAAGATSATKTTTCFYGPYLRAIPAQPVGVRKGSTGIAAAEAVGIGWLYTAATGTIVANTAALADDRGVLYSDY